MQILKVKKFPFLISTLINTLVLCYILVFKTPVYKSVHDSFLALNSSGCYWENINGNMHFHWAWFFLLGKIVKFINIHFPNINGYSFVLYSYMYISAIAICSAFFKYLNLKTALLTTVTVLFVVYVPYYYLVIDFSNASIVMASSAALWFVIKIQDGQNKITAYTIPILGMLLAILMRYHTAVIIIIAGLLLGLFIIKKWSRFILLAPAIIAFAWIIFQGHAAYQKNTYPNWEREENYTSAVYSYINFPSKSGGVNADTVTEKMIREGLFFDKNYLSEKKVLEFVNSRKYVFSNSYSQSQLQSFKWFLINNKFLLLFCLCCLLLYLYFEKNYFPFFYFLGIFVAIVLARLLFKEVNYLFLGILVCSALMLLFFTFRNTKKPFAVQFIIFPLIILGSLRYAYAVDQMNKNLNKNAIADIAFVRRHYGKKFISVMNGFDMDNIAANKAYTNINLRNMLPMDIQLNYNEDTVFKSWNLTSVQDIINRDDIFFFGKRSEALHDLFVNIYKTDVTEIADSSGQYYQIKKRILITK